MIKKNGFTLIEVVVSAIILLTSIMIVMASLANLSQPVSESDERLKAVVYGRMALDELRGQITKDVWLNSSGPFAVGTHNFSEMGLTAPAWLNTATGNYKVSDEGSGLKKVVVNVSFQ